MHHSGGAAAETVYIYGDVLDRAHQILRDSCKTCVVGLGLGYIEICWALSLLKKGLRPSPKISFHSFEVVSGLIENFKTWISSEQAHSVYDQIVFKLDPEASISEVKKILSLALSSGSFLNGDFSQIENHQDQYNVICYDAFSRKTSEDLWQSTFLTQFFQGYAASDCVVTTYACTGVLRKVLLEQQFSFFKRPGFCGKRDSSLASRGQFKIEDFQSSYQTSSCNR